VHSGDTTEYGSKHLSKAFKAPCKVQYGTICFIYSNPLYYFWIVRTPVEIQNHSTVDCDVVRQGKINMLLLLASGGIFFTVQAVL